MYSKPERRGFLCKKFGYELRRHRGYEKGQIKIQSSLEFCPSTTPQIEPLIYVPDGPKGFLIGPVWDIGVLQPKNDCFTVKDLQQCRPMSHNYNISIKFGQ